MKDANAVVIRTFGSVSEAQLYKALLESAGIPARMKNDIAAQVLPAYGGMMEVDLLVSAENEKKAKEILAARFDEKEFAEETKSKRSKKIK